HAADATTAGFATGARVGEMTSTSARVWARLTNSTQRAPGNGQFENIDRKKKDTFPTPSNSETDQLQRACPPAAGQGRVRYSRSENLDGAKSTDWSNVTLDHDGIHHFDLTGLTPGAD